MITTEELTNKLNELVSAEVEKNKCEISPKTVSLFLSDKSKEDIETFFTDLFSESVKISECASNVLSFEDVIPRNVVIELARKLLDSDDVLEIGKDVLSDNDIIELAEYNCLEKNIAENYKESLCGDEAREWAKDLIDSI